MEAIQNLPKRPKRPPVYLISEGGKIVENPSSTQIIDEISMVVMPPIRVLYELFMGNPDDELMVNPRATGAVANTLFSALERWEQLSGYLCKPEKERATQKDEKRFQIFVHSEKAFITRMMEDPEFLRAVEGLYKDPDTQDLVVRLSKRLEAAESCEIIRSLEQPEAAEEAKPDKSTFQDPRFSEYVAQIKVDGHDPIDILEAWLKEHNPEFLEDD